MSDELDRRQFLCTGCAAATMAACGGPGGTAPAGTDTDADTGLPVSQPGTGVATGFCEAALPTDTEAPGWFSYDIQRLIPDIEPVGGWTGRPHPGDGRNLIIAHVTADCYVAMERRCSHQNTMLTYDDARGQFVCPNHASLFDWEGHVVGGPAPNALETFPVVRDGDTLWIYYKSLA